MCDSFAGLPPSTLTQDRQYGSWDQTRYTEVSEREVKGNFKQHGVADSGVVFAQGLFSRSLPAVRALGVQLAVIRFDGDMYEGATDMLYSLYDRLSVGGYVIIDDWTGFPSKNACLDFFRVHKMSPEIVKIDRLSVYWRKAEEVEVQHWRYEKKEFT